MPAQRQHYVFVPQETKLSLINTNNLNTSTEKKKTFIKIQQAFAFKPSLPFSLPSIRDIGVNNYRCNEAWLQKRCFCAVNVMDLRWGS